jgi:hypothetical protein
MIRRYRGHGSGTHLSDQSSIQRREWFAGLRAKQKDHGVMGVCVSIARVERHEFCAKRAAIRRHYSKETIVFLNWKHYPNRLDYMSGRKIAQRIFHRWDQVRHWQMGANSFFIQKHHSSASPFMSTPR